MQWAGHVARMEVGRVAFKILTGKPTGKRPLGRPRRDLSGSINRFTSLCKNLFNLLEFLHSEVNLLIQHIIVQERRLHNEELHSCTVHLI